MNKSYWNGIRSFLAVAEHGSFTAASEQTGLTKASLSQQVSTLEQSLGVQLLHRTTRSVKLTEAGKGYYQKCRQGFEQLESARQWVCQANQALAGPIRMNAVGGLIGEEVIAPLLIEFQQQYPEIELSLDFSSERVDLMNTDYDLVMRMGELPDSSLIARRLHLITTRYVASPSLLAKLPAIEHPEQLKDLPAVCGSVSRWQLSDGNEFLSVTPGPGFRIANGRVMLQAAEAGLGISRLADIYTDAAIADGRLLEVLPQWQQHTPLSLVCPPARHQLQRVRALMDWLVEEFAARYREVMTAG